MQKQTEFVGHEIAGILQNISRNREDKRISRDDIKNAVAAAYLSIYPGKSAYVTNTSGIRHIYGNAAYGNIYAVRGVSGGKAQVIWQVVFHLTGDTTACTSPGTMRYIYGKFSAGESIIPSVEFSFSKVLPGSDIKNEEFKILVECSLFFEKSGYYGLANGSNWGKISTGQAFGFQMLNPKPRKGRTYFNSVAIFTPNSKLFDETAPAN
jgi:hypothetical protein